MEPTLGSAFAGIGGIDLGFQRAGFKTVWQVEKDSYCRKVLAKNFPATERYADIRDCGAHNLRPVDVIAGGFPCQDISHADEKVSLMTRRRAKRPMGQVACLLLDELRPQYVVVENVAALLGRGAARVLGDFAEIGYDADWEIISAADVGAEHLRERVWIVAYPYSSGCKEFDFASVTKRQGLSTRLLAQAGGAWRDESGLGRVAHGIPERVDRIRALGNAVVPQIPELIARQIASALLTNGKRSYTK